MEAKEWVDRLFRINMVQVGLNFVLTALIAGSVFYPSSELESQPLEMPMEIPRGDGLRTEVAISSAQESNTQGAPENPGEDEIPRAAVVTSEAANAPPPEQDTAAQTPVANYLRDVIAQLDTAAKEAGVDLRGYLPSREERMAAEVAADVSDPAVQRVLTRLTKGYTRLGKTLPAYGSPAPTPAPTAKTP